MPRHRRLSSPPQMQSASPDGTPPEPKSAVVVSPLSHFQASTSLVSGVRRIMSELFVRSTGVRQDARGSRTQPRATSQVSHGAHGLAAPPTQTPPEQASPM